MNTSEQKVTISLNPAKVKKVINLAKAFSGTQEETLKDLFKDLLIEIPQGENNKVAILSVSNAKDLLQIAIPIEKPITLDETVLIRVDAGKFKGIINNFEKNIKIEFTEKHIKFISDKSSIKIAKLPGNILKEQFDIIKISKEKEKITTINADIFLEVLNQVSQIPLSEQKSGNPVAITFLKEKIRTSAVQEMGHYAAAGEIDYPCDIDEPITLYLHPETVSKIIQILKILNNKIIEILVDIGKTKMQIKTKLLSYTVFLSGETSPKVHELIETVLAKDTVKKVLIEKNEIIKTMDLINFVCGNDTEIVAKFENNKANIKTNSREEVTKELDVITNENAQMNVSSTVMLKSIKTYSNSKTEESNKSLELILNEEDLNYIIKNPEKEYPAVIFAGMKS